MHTNRLVTRGLPYLYKHIIFWLNLTIYIFLYLHVKNYFISGDTCLTSHAIYYFCYILTPIFIGGRGNPIIHWKPRTTSQRTNFYHTNIQCILILYTSLHILEPRFDGDTHELIMYRCWSRPFLNILCFAEFISKCTAVIKYILKTFFITMMFSWCIFTCEKHWNHVNISPGGEVWSHKPSLTPPHFLLKCLFQSRKSECLWISILHLSTIVLLDFRIVSPVWFFLFFVFHFYYRLLALFTMWLSSSCIDLFTLQYSGRQNNKNNVVPLININNNPNKHSITFTNKQLIVPSSVNKC